MVPGAWTSPSTTLWMLLNSWLGTAYHNLEAQVVPHLQKYNGNP